MNSGYLFIREKRKNFLSHQGRGGKELSSMVVSNALLPKYRWFSAVHYSKIATADRSGNFDFLSEKLFSTTEMLLLGRC